MNTGIERIREEMARYLNSHGVRALTAWPGQERSALTGPAAAVSLRSCQAGPSGFQDYLGERFNPDSGRWEELYGKRAELRLGLDLYAGAGTDGQDLQSAFDRLVRALQQGGPQGVQVLEISGGETAFDSAQGLLHRPVEALCRVWLCAAAEPGGEFLDFDIRGGVQS